MAMTEGDGCLSDLFAIGGSSWGIGDGGRRHQLTLECKCPPSDAPPGTAPFPFDTWATHHSTPAPDLVRSWRHHDAAYFYTTVPYIGVHRKTTCPRGKTADGSHLNSRNTGGQPFVAWPAHGGRNLCSCPLTFPSSTTSQPITALAQSSANPDNITLPSSHRRIENPTNPDIEKSSPSAIPGDQISIRQSSRPVRGPCCHARGSTGSGALAW